MAMAMAMASASDTLLAEQLDESGNCLLHSLSSAVVDELLPLLDRAEDLLLDVEQAPNAPIKDALLPIMKALKSDTLLKHPDVTVKVSVASCIHEIARITAPLEPYDDETMKDIFKLTVSSLEKLSQPSTRCYEKAASIIYTIAQVRSCVMMLDLKCDDLVAGMFRLFLKTTGLDHSEDVLWAMERIMTLILKESEVITMDLLEPLLASVRNDNRDIAPISWKLGKSVISNCRDKLRPALREAIGSAGISLEQYAPVLRIICGSASGVSEQSLANGSLEHGGFEALSPEVGAKLELDGHIASVPETESVSEEEDSSSKLKSFDLLNADGLAELTSSSKRRDRRPNSLLNPAEGYEPFWGLQERKHPHIKPRKVGRPKNFQKGKQRKVSRKKSHDMEPAVALPETSFDEEGELAVGSEQKQQSQTFGEPTSSSTGTSFGKRSDITSNKEKPTFSGKKKAKLSACKSSVKDGSSLERTSEKGLKRKWTPKKRAKSGQQFTGEEIVGQKIKVWWPKDKVFYDGVVCSYNRRKETHQVVYTDDGVEEELNLKKHLWKLIEDDLLDSASHRQSEPPEILNTLPKRRAKSTVDSNPNQLERRDGDSSSPVRISDKLDEDESMLADTKVGKMPQTENSEVEDAKTSQRETGPDQC